MRQGTARAAHREPDCHSPVPQCSKGLSFSHTVPERTPQRPGCLTFRDATPRSSSQSAPPGESGKPGESPVHGDEGGAGLDGHGRQIGVGNHVAARPEVPAQALKDAPMLPPWADADRRRGAQHRLAEIQRHLRRSRSMVDPVVRHDSQKTRQDQLGHPEGFVGGQRDREPRVVFREPRGLRPVRLDEQVDVSEQHDRPRREALQGRPCPRGRRPASTRCRRRWAG